MKRPLRASGREKADCAGVGGAQLKNEARASRQLSFSPEGGAGFGAARTKKAAWYTGLLCVDCGAKVKVSDGRGLFVQPVLPRGRLGEPWARCGDCPSAGLAGARGRDERVGRRGLAARSASLHSSETRRSALCGPSAEPPHERSRSRVLQGTDDGAKVLLPSRTAHEASQATLTKGEAQRPAARAPSLPGDHRVPRDRRGIDSRRGPLTPSRQGQAGT